MKNHLVALSALIALCMTAPMAFAGGGGHGGGHGDRDARITKCRVTVDGQRVDVSGTVKNLNKKKDTRIALRIKGKVIGDCINPGGNSPRPHQNKELEFEEARDKEYKAGNRKIDFKFKNVKLRVSAADVCPNENWTFEIKKVKLFNVIIKVYQDGKTVAYKECL